MEKVEVVAVLILEKIVEDHLQEFLPPVYKQLVIHVIAVKNNCQELGFVRFVVQLLNS